MGPTTGTHSFGALEHLIREAKAGTAGSEEMVLAACRQLLLAIARQELPEVRGREADIQTLVERALARVPAVLAAFAGKSEGDLYAELRREFLHQLRTFSGWDATDPAASLPTTDHPQRSESLANDSLAGVQTVPAPGMEVPDESGAQVPPALTQLEGFENVGEVGGGGMGVVYRAWQTRLKRWVALKRLPRDFADDPDRLRRFRQEALLTAGLTEPGIVQVYDVLEKDGIPILVLPYIDGGDLNKIIGQRQRLRQGKDVPHPHPEALKSERDYVAGMLPFFDRILDALVGLHGAGVLHRDLKPSNILVDKNGNGWLADFGLARLTRSDTATRQPRVMGTPGFMSPEQWDGYEDTDARTDVFALGVTVYEALTLDLPYRTARITAATPPATFPKPRRRFLPSDLDLVLLKAVHPDRQLRYQTAADLRDDWQRVRKGYLPQKAGVDWGRRLLHVARRRLSQGIAAVAVGVAAVLAVMLPPHEPKKDRKVQVTTEPPGARVALVPLDPVEGTLQFDRALQPEDKTPVTLPRVPPGDYLVVVEVPGHGFHEVYRRVPEPGEDPPTIINQNFAHTSFKDRAGIVELPPISVPKSEDVRGMQLFTGGEFTMGSADYGPAFVPPHARTVEPF